MPTPNFNSELLKLRRRLGDVRTEDGVDITVTDIGTLDGNIWRAGELSDIYNDAVRDYLDFVVTSIPKEVWYSYIPGFIRHANPTTNDGYIGYSTIIPSPFFFLSIFNTEHENFPLQFSYIPPDEYTLTRLGKFPHRRPSEDELYYTVFTVTGAEISVVLIPATAYTHIEMVYIRNHSNIVADGATDLEGITESGLRKIIDFAEAEAYKQKQAIAPELVQKMLELKTKIAASNVGGQQ